MPSNCCHDFAKDVLYHGYDKAVSHPVKGRIPEAKHKSASDLLEEEKTVYYERVMSTIEIPTIYRDINGNHLSLTVNGVRGYH
jgi:hypothetical protein